MTKDEKTGYWIVTLQADAFETKDEAISYRDALIDAFCAMPESEGYSASTTIDFEDATQ